MVIAMRGVLIPVIAAGFAALIFAGPKPAAATPAGAALAYGESHAGIVEQVGKRYRYSRNYRRAPYYRGYAYRPNYWGRPYYGYYGYRRPYYGYYGYGGPGIYLNIGPRWGHRRHWRRW